MIEGLPIQWGKELKSFTKTEDGGVSVEFKDGTSLQGDILIGADGSGSTGESDHSPTVPLMTAEHALVRSILNGAGLEEQPVTLLGATRHFTADEAEPFAGKFLFHTTEPKKNTFIWYGAQTIYTGPDGRDSLDAFVAISWAKEAADDALPSDHKSRIKLMKERAQIFAEPIRSIITGMPDDLNTTARIRVADYPCHPWKNGGIATLAGDAAHAMTMYRGEGANHGVLDAALIVDQLVEINTGRRTKSEGLKVYEDELYSRAPDAVLRSRQAALDAHIFEAIIEGSPLVGPRVVPKVLKGAQA